MQRSKCLESSLVTAALLSGPSVQPGHSTTLPSITIYDNLSICRRPQQRITRAKLFRISASCITVDLTSSCLSDCRQDGLFSYPRVVPQALLTIRQPSATGQNWEKYQKTYADDEVEEKKITPLTDECVLSTRMHVLSTS